MDQTDGGSSDYGARVVAQRDQALAAEIAARHGLRAGDVTPLVGRGSVNHVFIVHSDAARHVVRVPVDPLRSNEYEVEAWALAQAAAHGIPSPRVVARGCLRDVPYLVQTFVEGAPTTTERSRASWRTLGEYAKVVHRIPVTAAAPDGLFSRFGRDPRAAWEAHLHYNLDQLREQDPLLRLRVYATDQQARLRSVLSRLAHAPISFGLIHGDLSLRNLLVASGRRPVLIDWGSASVGPVPFGDLQPLVQAHRDDNDPSDAELQAFAEGLDISLQDLSDTLDGLLLLSALDLVRWAIERRPDRLGDVIRSARAHIAQSRPMPG